MSETTFRQLLGEFETAATSSSAKGRVFEEFCQAFFRIDPYWAARLDEVWLWQEWPGRGTESDSGIDLVACERGSGTLVAIQCKFYRPSATIGQEQLGKLLSMLGRKDFGWALFVSTTDRWSHKAITMRDRHEKPLRTFGVDDFEASAVDWSVFRIERPAELDLRLAKTIRPHQTTAIDAVLAGLAAHERGQLVMACGTGKTFTSLRIAEALVGRGGTVLFLVPSINLLSQSVKAWANDAAIPLVTLAVCSDVGAGQRKKGKDDEDRSPNDLSIPASTDSQTLAAELAERANDRMNAMTVVFSTYQSIEVIRRCQADTLPVFDLLIADEAHRTTGVVLADGDDSVFTRVHDNACVAATRRLYMTATPRVYAQRTKDRADEHGAFLATMDDESTFGPVLHRLAFGEAVARELLTDYKVLVLAVDEGAVSRSFQAQLADDGIELNLDDAARITGCWHALSKRGPQFEHDRVPMRRAVSFTSTIKQSKRFTETFPALVNEALEDRADPNSVKIETEHVDGQDSVMVRTARIAWLEEEPGAGVCRVLSNAKCLTEGVDVPALDAILFLTPRRSIVDVVQAVGRVMRLADDKEFGYVILPIAVPAGLSPEEALRDNARYEVVWEVLQALRSHDERLNAEINKIDINRSSDKIRVIGIGLGGDAGDPDGLHTTADDALPAQLDLPGLSEWRDAIYARIVEKVGDRHYWEKWAADIGEIAERHETRIRGILERKDLNPEIASEFDAFHTALRAHLNDSIDRDGAIAMLSQHLITRPVFDALFGNDHFVRSNPVSRVMQRMIDRLDERRVDRETGTDTLQRFYESVRVRAEGIEDAAGKQKIIAELYQQFFTNAIPKLSQSLGIVYTPVEIVDFINRSVDELLRTHFGGVSIGDAGVHVLDPFTGTGTFLSRLLGSDLIRPEDRERKYRHELHANELLLLAYYVAAINIESTYHDLAGTDAYEPFDGIVLADTFQADEAIDLVDAAMFPTNLDRAERQRKLDIRVIVGNPPYSAGQGSQNDLNENQKYPDLDRSITDSYAALSRTRNKKSLYDSYIRAFRWSSNRVLSRPEGGIIAMVTNGGWLDGKTQDGMRRSLRREFHEIYVVNLRGNARAKGELRRQEGDNVFAEGSRTTVVLTLLVKARGSVPAEGARIFYHDIGDYLSRTHKLERLGSGRFDTLDWRRIVPNDEADWLTLRSTRFDTLTPLSGGDDAIFLVPSNGVKTARDPWVTGSSRAELTDRVESMIGRYHEESDAFHAAHPTLPRTVKAAAKLVEASVSKDRTRFAWLPQDYSRIVKRQRYELRPEMIRKSLYRPFFRNWVVMHGTLNHAPSEIQRLLPTPKKSNIGFALAKDGSKSPFGVLATDLVPGFHMIGSDASSFLARWHYGAAGDGPQESNINPRALARFKKAFGMQVDDDGVFAYVYAMLHAPAFRDEFGVSLRKEPPRVPLVSTPEDFERFVDAGKALLDLHLNYERVEPHELVEHWLGEPRPAGVRWWELRKLEYPRPPGSSKGRDRTRIRYNDLLTLSDIPTRAHEYVIGTQSALDWVVERYAIKTDGPSGIVNDPNEWGTEHASPSYVIDLIRRVVTVSLRTLDVIDSMPAVRLEGPESHISS